MKKLIYLSLILMLAGLFFILMPPLTAAEWDAYFEEFAKEMRVANIIVASSMKGVVQETPSLSYSANRFNKYNVSERAMGRVSRNLFSDYEYSVMKVALLNYSDRLSKSEDVPLIERVEVLRRLGYAYGIPAGFPLDLAVEWVRFLSIPQ